MLVSAAQRFAAKCWSAPLSVLLPNVGRRRSAFCCQMLVGGVSVLLPNVGRRRSTVCCQMLVGAAQRFAAVRWRFRSFFMRRVSAALGSVCLRTGVVLV
eukprot:108610-Chlamydomonas_euryale.AAC.1